MLAAMAFKEVIAGFLSPVAVRSAYYMSASLAVARPDPMTAWTMHFRGDLPRETIVSQLRDVGWTEEMVDQFRKVAETLISTGEAIQLYWRGDYDRVALQNTLYKQGYSRDDTASISLIGTSVRAAYRLRIRIVSLVVSGTPGTSRRTSSIGIGSCSAVGVRNPNP
ncbi:hypothetical protein ES703_104546 [subsurface metagenome]